MTWPLLGRALRAGGGGGSSGSRGKWWAGGGAGGHWTCVPGGVTPSPAPTRPVPTYPGRGTGAGPWSLGWRRWWPWVLGWPWWPLGRGAAPSAAPASGALRGKSAARTSTWARPTGDAGQGTRGQEDREPRRPAPPEILDPRAAPPAPTTPRPPGSHPRSPRRDLAGRKQQGPGLGGAPRRFRLGREQFWRWPGTRRCAEALGPRSVAGPPEVRVTVSQPLGQRERRSPQPPLGNRRLGVFWPSPGWRPGLCACHRHQATGPAPTV